ncbi:MAG TPA: FMN-binding negative transcriptional regulator [Streptosporangiaceae bacterium]|nr:FMN-binding negative transcriptional regulator [Streptosporangiaceae bacterium]
MYVPAHFAVGDLDQVAEFVGRVGAADLVTFDGTRPVATLLPVIWERPPAGENGSAEGGHGRLLGHIALNNPQWKTAAAGASALAIVHGPQAYVSPSWYPSKKEHGRAVPTWNYTTVHFVGQITFHKDADWLRDIVTRLTDRHETGREDRWRVTDAPEKYIDGQLRAIIGVELQIEQIEAKDKLSQNRSPQDRTNVIAALQAEPDPQAHEIADLMNARETRELTTSD